MAWQNFYLMSRPLEKGHFTPKTAKCPRFSVTKYIPILFGNLTTMVPPKVYFTYSVLKF